MPRQLYFFVLVRVKGQEVDSSSANTEWQKMSVWRRRGIMAS